MAIIHRKVRYWDGKVHYQRIVNQEEIVDYLTFFPFQSENEIMESIYGFVRKDGFESNKKYAECLRRALYSGKIARVEAKQFGSKSKYFYYVPKS